MASPKLRHNIDHEITKNGIVYKMAKTPEELEQVMEFIFNIFLKGKNNHYVFKLEYVLTYCSTICFADEPICSATELDTTDRRPAHMKLFRDILEDGISLIALDSAKDNQMIGIRVSFTIQK